MKISPGRTLALIAASAAVLATFAVASLAGAAVPNYQPCAPGVEPGSEARDDDPTCYAVDLAGGADYTIRPLLSVGDTVPETSNPALQYQMVGIPDGLGAYESGDDEISVFMNHEFVNAVLSTPVIGAPQNRGAFVSKLTLDEDGNVLSGERAYDTVFSHDYSSGSEVVTQLPAAQVDNSTPGFGRLCSGNLSVDDGFDRPICFAGEEANGAGTFDGRGGQAVAIFDNQLHTLPHLGRFSWENALVMSDTGNRTVIMGMEDGPATPDNQLYMYVGRKVRNSSDPLARNGLNTGDLYVFVSNDPARNSETTFTNGQVNGRWVLIPDAEKLTETQIEAASDAVNAMTFIRPEDGAFSPSRNNEFLFVTTGGNPGAGNGLGRLYSLRLNADNVLRPADLRVVYNADQVIAAGQDIAISPDNIDISEDFLMINEDGTANSRPIMAQKERDGSIWRFPVTNGSFANRIDVAGRERISELDPPGKDNIPVGPGIWETSGIIDVSDIWGEDSWLFDAQANPPTTAPGVNTVEDGQLLLMISADDGDEDDEEGEDDDEEDDDD